MDLNDRFVRLQQSYLYNLFEKDNAPEHIKVYGYQRYSRMLSRMAKEDKYVTKMREETLDRALYFYGLRFAHPTYIVILESILNCYNVGNNYENFCCVVDDLSNLIIKRDAKSSEIDDFLCCIYLEALVSNPYYKDMPNYREFIKRSICNLDLEAIKNIYDMYDKMHICGRKINSEYRAKVLDSRIGGLLNPLSDIVFYSDILLVKKDRYFYINEKLIEIEDSVYWRKTIFDYINNLNINMFDEINVEDGKDSFIVIMDKVFNSDSYFELFSKLRVLSAANKLYSSGDKETSFEMINSIDNDCYKENYLGKEVCYPSNTMNVINKPKKIIDRMKYLYRRVDDSISYDFMDDIHNSVIDYPSFCTKFDIAINMEKNKAKYKSKRFFNKMFKK